jgi:hypothetical protein
VPRAGRRAATAKRARKQGASGLARRRRAGGLLGHWPTSGGLR